MTNQTTVNPAASVRQRLLNIARRDGVDFQALLTRYAFERLLYRLGTSPYREELILKGAFLFAAWGDFVARPTADLDFLAFGEPAIARFEAIVRDLCAATAPADGLEYHADSVRGAAIREQALHDGIRIRLRANLGSARIPLQIDIGFGDAAAPGPVDIAYPSLLQMPAALVRAYRVEAVIAEKLEALVSIGVATSRLKDFFDIWRLSCLTSLDGLPLQLAVASTFERRATPIPSGLPPALGPEFSSRGDRGLQWARLADRLGIEKPAPTLGEVCAEIWEFVRPIFSHLRDGRPFTAAWKPGGPWTPSGG
jgi:predicted nucleotidyltransferase component of viral defense system